MFERKCYEKLVKWKDRSNGRTALLVEGARRVGKTTLVEAFAGAEYDAHLVIDFSKTTDLIAEKRCFTVAIADRANLVAADYVGIVSGNKESEKVAKAGWTAVPGEQVDAPVFQELPVTMECKVVSISEELGETCVVGEVVNTQVSEAHLTEAGKVDVSGMLADEPTAGLDAENARAVHALLREAADDGAAVLLVTHEQGAEEYADRVLHMDGGRLSG